MKSARQYQQLDYQERQTIAIGREQGLSIRAIARILNRAPSTISREIERNCGVASYAFRFAHHRCVRRRRMGRPGPRTGCWQRVVRDRQSTAQARWSPQQIAARLATLHPDAASQRASPETIYFRLYAQPRGELRRELVACLRMARAKRWPRSRGEDRRGQIADLLSIHVRPPEVEDRQFPGHWEGDLIKGAGNLRAVGTLVERTTHLVILVKLSHPNPATAAHVLQAFTDKLNTVVQPMRKMLTYDRGREMEYHQQLTANTGVTVYFCDPHTVLVNVAPTRHQRAAAPVSAKGNRLIGL